MANKYYALSIDSTSAFITTLQNALVDKYGEDVEIASASSSDLIFRCQKISDKYIRIQFYSDIKSKLIAYYGSGFSNGSLTDSVTFCDTYGSYTPLAAHLVLGDSFMFLDYSKENYSAVIVVGKTIGGTNVCCGYGNTSLIAERSKAYNADNGLAIKLISYGTTVYHSVGMPYKTKLLIAYNSAENENMLLTLPDGTADTIKDLYMSFYAGAAPVCTITGLFSRRNVFTNGDSSTKQLTTSLLAEFET